MTDLRPTDEQRAEWDAYTASILRQRYSDLNLSWSPGCELPVDAVAYLANQLARHRDAIFAAGVEAALDKERREAELDAWIEAERTGTEEGHQHCPECGCDPDDHTLHAKVCARADSDDLKISCTNPDGSWNPWPGESVTDWQPTP